MNKIEDSEVFKQYPACKLDVHYINKLGERFDFGVVQKRADILLQEVVAAGYGRYNISDHAIADVAKTRKIAYFLKDIRCRKKIVAKIKAAL